MLEQDESIDLLNPCQIIALISHSSITVIQYDVKTVTWLMFTPCEMGNTLTHMQAGKLGTEIHCTVVHSCLSLRSASLVVLGILPSDWTCILSCLWILAWVFHSLSGYLFNLSGCLFEAGYGLQACLGLVRYLLCTQNPSVTRPASHQSWSWKS